MGSPLLFPLGKLYDNSSRSHFRTFTVAISSSWYTLPPTLHPTGFSQLSSLGNIIWQEPSQITLTNVTLQVTLSHHHFLSAMALSRMSAPGKGGHVFLRTSVAQRLAQCFTRTREWVRFYNHLPHYHDFLRKPARAWPCFIHVSALWSTSALTLTSCVNSGKSLNLSGPQVPKRIPSSEFIWGLNKIIHVGYPA